MTSSLAKPLATLILASAGRGAIDSGSLSHHFYSAAMHLS